MEIWKDIKGYEGYYQVSNKGNIKSLERTDRNGFKRKERLLTLGDNGRGYKRVHLSKDMVAKWYSVHRLVAEVFVERKQENDTIVNHIDNNRSNNNAENLEWTTYKGNMEWASLQGRMKANATAYENLRKSCEKRKTPVIAICPNGDKKVFLSQTEAGEHLGVNRSHIAAACRKEYGYKTLKGYSFEYLDPEKRATAKPNKVKMTDDERKKRLRECMIGNQHGKGKKPSEKNIRRSRETLSKPIFQLDENRNIIAEYPSAIEATRQTGVRHPEDVANGKRKTAGGYIWEWRKK